MDSELRNSSQRELFENWIPPWIRGESLFGLCSRYHRIAGHGPASTTSMRLFGHPRVGTNHDLPGRIDELVKRSGGQLGDAECVLWQRTLMGYYMRFLGESAAQRAISVLRAQGPATLKAQLGWLASRFGASHPLRACPACVKEDLLSHQIPTWHLAHQLPGVWLCPTHKAPLTC